MPCASPFLNPPKQVEASPGSLAIRVGPGSHSVPGFGLGRIAVARAWVTADNEYELYVNGRRVGAGEDWEHPDSYDLAAALRAGRNVLAVRAGNTGLQAGLLLAARVITADGRETACLSGPEWRVSTEPPAGWQEPGFDDAGWGRPVVLGPANADPWRLPAAFGQWVGVEVSPATISPNGDGLNDQVTIRLDNNLPGPISARLAGPGGRIVPLGKELPTGESTVTWTGRAAGSRLEPAGRYEVQTAPLGTRAWQAAGAVTLEDTPAVPAVRYRHAPFFPIGVWFEGNPDWGGYVGDPAGAGRYYDRCFADLAAHGLNTVVVPNCPPALWQTLLASANRHGLRAVVEILPLRDLVGDSGVTETAARRAAGAVVRAIGPSPALLRYQIRDEPPPDMMPAWLLVQRALAAADPVHPAFSCFNNPDSLAAARAASRLPEAVFDIYPFGVQTPQQDLGSFPPALQRFRQAAGGTALWPVLQCFAKPGAWRYPTTEELSAATWLSLAAGAKGMFYFLYQTMPQHPERLEGMIDPEGKPAPIYATVERLAAMLRRLSALLLGLQPAGEPQVTPDGMVGQFRDGQGKRVLILASAQPGKAVELTAPAGQWRDALTGGAVDTAGHPVSLPPGGGCVLVEAR